MSEPTTPAVVFALGLAHGERPAKVAAAFGGSFRSLVPFTMQMALVIIGGFVVASSPPVARVIAALAAIPILCWWFARTIRCLRVGPSPETKVQWKTPPVDCYRS